MYRVLPPFRFNFLLSQHQMIRGEYFFLKTTSSSLVQLKKINTFSKKTNISVVFWLDSFRSSPVTRSLSKALKIIGVSIPTEQKLSRKIRMRRATMPTELPSQPKPKKRSTRFQSLPETSSLQSSKNNQIIDIIL